MIAELARRTGVHVAIAFVAMGGWALIANWSHPLPVQLVAAVVQGRGWWLPPLVMCSIALGVLIVLHLLAGTPEILATISLPFAVSTSYAIAYNTLRWRKGQSR